MNPIIGGMNYINRAIDSTRSIPVTDISQMTEVEVRHIESIVGHDEPEEINDLGGGGEPLDPVPF